MKKDKNNMKKINILKLRNFFLFYVLFFVNLPYVAPLANVTYSGALLTDPSTTRYDIIITPVTAPSEDVVINGQSIGYVNSTRNTITFNERSVLNFIPTNVFKYFPNIQIATIRNASVTTLVTDAFMYCSTLRQISITDNPALKELPSRFAQTCTNITSIYIQRNGVEVIQVDALQGLSKLTNIDFQSNKIKSIPPGFFAYTPLVTFAKLSINSLTQLDVDTLQGLSELQVIDFMYNSIKCFPTGLFAYSPKLIQIFFDYNLLTQININAFAGLSSLQIVKFLGNQITA